MSIDRWAERAQDLALRGDFAGAAALFERAAADLLGARRLDDALSALLAAARLQMMLGNAQGPGDWRRDSGFARAAALLADAEVPARQRQRIAEVRHLQAELADYTGDVAARERAWTAARDLASGEARVFALRRLAEIARDTDRPADMIPLLDEALQISRDPEQQADTALFLSMAHHALGQLDRAEAAIERLPLTGAPSPLLARLHGQRGVLALARDRIDDALTHALAARSTAVALADAQNYLAASLLLVMIYQHGGRELDAYDTLIRARTSLTDLLGGQAAGLVQPALDAFEARHGEAGMATLHAQWVAMRQAKGA